MSAVDAHTAQRLGYPCGVACKELVVLGSSCELNKTELHDKLVYKLLDFAFGEGAFLKVSFCIYVKECRCSAKAHCRAVLLFDSAKVAEVECLDSLLHIGSGLGDIASVDVCKLCKHLESLNLLGNLFDISDIVCSHGSAGKVLLHALILDKLVDTVESDSSVVTDDTASAVSIGQTCDDVVGTALSHICVVYIKHTCVMSLSVG